VVVTLRSAEGDAPYMGAMQIRTLINSENTSCRAACLHPTLPLRVILNEVKDLRSRYTANLIVFAEILRQSLRMTKLWCGGYPRSVVGDAPYSASLSLQP